MMQSLTEREQSVLDFMLRRIEAGTTPTVREIMDACHFKSTSHVQKMLLTLEEKGYIARGDGHSRGWRIVGMPGTTHVRLLGQVTAGVPITAVENVEGYIPIPSEWGGGGELFALRVLGDSMKGAGILDGDIVVVEKAEPAANGEIVVALIGEEATVKRYYFENGKIRLQPENPLYEPILPDECELLGKVITCIRYYK